MCEVSIINCKLKCDSCSLKERVRPPRAQLFTSDRPLLCNNKGYSVTKQNNNKKNPAALELWTRRRPLLSCRRRQCRHILITEFYGTNNVMLVMLKGYLTSQSVAKGVASHRRTATILCVKFCWSFESIRIFVKFHTTSERTGYIRVQKERNNYRSS